MRIAEITGTGWRRFVVSGSSECMLATAIGEVAARWELGVMVARRSAVFHRHMACIALEDATDEFIGIDEPPSPDRRSMSAF